MAQPSLQSPVHGSTLWPELPPSPLTGICVVRLDEAWERPLQRFYEANPQYFLEALGQPPASDQAIQEIRDLPPEDFSYTALFLLGFVQEDGELMAMASVGVMVKPLSRNTVQDYLRLVPRDRPPGWLPSA